jgi:hypothetical protein
MDIRQNFSKAISEKDNCLIEFACLSIEELKNFNPNRLSLWPTMPDHADFAAYLDR